MDECIFIKSKKKKNIQHCAIKYIAGLIHQCACIPYLYTLMID